MFSIDLTKRYGIMLSGGLDSAVLLYLLISNEPNIQLQPFTIPKFDGAAQYADPVIEYINNKFNVSIPKTILVGNPMAHHRLQSATAVLEIFSKHNIDQLYIAINKNPTELLEYPGAPSRASVSNDARICLPFVNMLKDEIIKILVDNNELGLSEITHTCTEQSQGRCGVCWQCTERKWAFSQLNLIDHGLK